MIIMVGDLKSLKGVPTYKRRVAIISHPFSEIGNYFVRRGAMMARLPSFYPT